MLLLSKKYKSWIEMSHWKVTEDYFEHPSIESSTAFIKSMFSIKQNLLETYFSGHTKDCSSVSWEGRNINNKAFRNLGLIGSHGPKSGRAIRQLKGPPWSSGSQMGCAAHGNSKKELLTWTQTLFLWLKEAQYPERFSNGTLTAAKPQVVLGVS